MKINRFAGLIFSIVFIAIAIDSSSQVIKIQMDGLDTLKANTKSEVWNYKDITELFNRTETPHLAKYGPHGLMGEVGNTITTFDMRNNNLTGKIPASFMFTGGTPDGDKRWVGGVSDKRYIKLFFSHNNITEVTPYILHGKRIIQDVRLDNNNITDFNLKLPYSGVVGDGTYVFTIHQNNISTIKKSDILVGGYSRNGILNNRAKLMRIDNNRLGFGTLCEIVPLIEYMYSYQSFRIPGNPDCIFDYLPQKPLGGDYTEETLKKGKEKTLSFTGNHNKNIYSWQLNGKDVALSETKDYKFEIDESTAGVWRCKIRNPLLPDATLYSYDMAVFLYKAENKRVEDIAINQNTLSTNFPENAIVADFDAEDPDGDEIFYRLPDKTDDNSHFRIINGKTLVSSEPLFDEKYIEKYTISVEAYDIYGGKFVKQFDIVKSPEQPSTPLPDNITIDKLTVPENIADAIIDTLKLVGGDGYNLILDNEQDNSNFKIEDNILKTAVKFDYELKKKYNIRVSAKKDGFVLKKDFIIKITDANDAPYDLFITNSKFKTGTLKGSIIGQLIASDQDPSDLSFTYELTGTIADNQNFVIHENILKLAKYITTPTLFNIEVKVSDDEKADRVFSLKINAVENNVISDNKSPEGIWLSSNVLVADTKDNSTIGLLYSHDPENDELIYSTDNEYLYIESNNLKLKKSPQAGENINVNIKCSDGTTTISKTFIIYNLNKMKYAVSDICGLTSYDIDENSKIGDIIGEIATDKPDGDDISFTSENQYVNLEGSKLKLKTLPPAGNNINIEIVKHSGSETSSHSFVIFNLIPVQNPNNTPPMGFGITNLTIDKQLKVGNVFSSLFMCDAETTEGIFSCDNEYISITDNSVILKKIPENDFKCDIVCSDGEFEISHTFKFYYQKTETDISENINSGSLKYYPNPSVSLIKCEYNNNFESNVEVSVYSQSGILKYNKKYKKQPKGLILIEVPTTELNAGVYYLKINNGVNSETVSFVKQ